MIDNEDQVTNNFTKDLKLRSLPEMDRNLAIQLMESTLILTTVDNEDGVATALRAVCQEEAFNIRLDNCIKLGDSLWDAVRVPGAYTNKAKEWTANFKNNVKNILFDIYGPQLDEIEVTRDQLTIKGNIRHIFT